MRQPTIARGLALALISSFGALLSLEARADCKAEFKSSKSDDAFFILREDTGVVGWADCLHIAPDGSAKGVLHYVSSEKGTPVQHQLDAAALRVLRGQFDQALAQYAERKAGPRNRIYIFAVTHRSNTLYWQDDVESPAIQALQATIDELLKLPEVKTPPAEPSASK